MAVGELDGRPIVVSGSLDATVRVWHLGTGDPVGEPFTGHTGGVRAVAVGELDGRPIVVSCSGDEGDETVRVWDLAAVNNSRVIMLGVAVLSVTKPMNNVVVVGHRAGLTAVRI